MIYLINFLDQQAQIYSQQYNTNKIFHYLEIVCRVFQLLFVCLSGYCDSSGEHYETCSADIVEPLDDLL